MMRSKPITPKRIQIVHMARPPLSVCVNQLLTYSIVKNRARFHKIEHEFPLKP